MAKRKTNLLVTFQLFLGSFGSWSSNSVSVSLPPPENIRIQNGL